MNTEMQIIVVEETRSKTESGRFGVLLQPFER